MFGSLVENNYNTLPEVQAVRKSENYPVILEALSFDPFDLIAQESHSFSVEDQVNIQVELAGYMRGAIELHEIMVEGGDVDPAKLELINARLSEAERQLKDDTVSEPKRWLIIFGIVAFWAVVAGLVAFATGGAVIATIIYYAGILITAFHVGKQMGEQDKEAMGKAREKAREVRRALEQIEKTPAGRNHKGVKGAITRLEDLEIRSKSYNEFTATRSYD